MFGMTKTLMPSMPMDSSKRLGINVWASMVDGHLIRPYLLPPRLTGHTYLPIGAVRDHLNRCFGLGWIGRGGPIA